MQSTSQPPRRAVQPCGCQIVLPNPPHAVPHAPKLSGLALSAALITAQFRFPIVSPTRWDAAVLRTKVPETAIHEDDQPQ